MFALLMLVAWPPLPTLPLKGGGASSVMRASRPLLQRGGVDRQLSHALGGCGEDRVGDGRNDGGGPGLAHAAGLLGAADDVDIDRRRLVHAQDLVGIEIALLDAAVLERDLAVERRRDAEDD